MVLHESFIIEKINGGTTVETADAPRIEDYLLENSSLYFSRKSIRNALKAGLITVNSERKDRFYILNSGDTLYVSIEEKAPGPPFGLSLNVLFEDDCCAVVEKPPGFRVNGNMFQTVENALPFNLEKSGAPDALLKPRPVHRLDRATGGLLLAAKTRRAMIFLSREFQEGRVIKAYDALVAGYPGKEGEVDTPVDGRQALSRYMTLEKVPSLKNGEISHLRIFPETGRKHQIRRHCAELGTPVVGDALYSEAGNVLKGKGLFLWSTMISFRHPAANYAVCVKIEAPQKFFTTMQREERRWKKYN